MTYDADEPLWADYHDDDELGAQLEDYLGALSRDDCFRVDTVLKESPWERTERVFFVGANGSEQGPYIRKTIQGREGLGAVYQSLYQARLEGKRFRYLPAIYECHRAGEQTIVLMEYARGVTLRQLVSDTAPEERRLLALAVFPALLDAVAELHGLLEAPIIHRDLSPSNIVCPPDHPDRLTVIDLGIARTYKPDATNDTTHFGTRPYAPPEQYGFGQTDVRSDVFALGLVLFYILTGRDPSTSDRTNGWHDSAIDEAMRQIIEKACSLDPHDRFSDVTDMARGFSACPEVHSKPGMDLEESKQKRAEVPNWLGKAWNCIVCVVLALFLAASVLATFNPVDSNQAWPMWFRYYTYFGFVPSSMGIMAWILLDKRRLRKRLGLKRRRPLIRVLGFWVALFSTNMVLYLLIGNIAWVDIY